MKKRSFHFLFVTILLIVGLSLWRTKEKDLPQEPFEEKIANAESPQLLENIKPSSEALPNPKASIQAKKEDPQAVAIASHQNILARFSLSEFEEVELDLGDNAHSHKTREWKGKLTPDPAALEELFKVVDSEDSFTLILPDKTELKVGDLRLHSFGENRGTLTGRMTDDAYGEFVLSYVNLALAGSIRDIRNGMTWEIRNAGNGLQYIAEIDLEALGECGMCATRESGGSSE